VRRTPTTLQIGISVLAFALVACTAGTQPTGSPASPTAEVSPSIAGPYACGREGANVPTFVWELREDGTLQNVSPPDMLALGEIAEEKIASGTWSATGNAGKVTSQNVDYPFTIDAGSLVFADGEFVCGPIPE
jgi:hypothetical protein